MLNIFTVAFFGHRKITNIVGIEKNLEKLIIKLVEENEYVDFLVGRNGDFDICASATVKHMQEKYHYCNSTIVLMLPYKTAEYSQNKKSFEEFYGEVEICEKARGIFPKRAIQIRNREMVDRADLIICYIERDEGGAFQTIKYALEQGKAVINIAKKDNVLS